MPTFSSYLAFQSFSRTLIRHSRMMASVVVIGATAACGPAPVKVDSELAPAKTVVLAKLAAANSWIPAATAFAVGEEASFDITVDQFRALQPALLLQRALAADFSGSLQITARADAPQNGVLSLAVGANTCAVTFDLANVPATDGKPATGCVDTLFKDLGAFAPIAAVPVKATLTAATTGTMSLTASLGTPSSGTARTLTYGLTGSTTKLALASGQSVGEVKDAAITGTIRINEPATNAGDMAVTVALLVDLNIDGNVSADEVVSSAVALGEDVSLSKLVPTAFLTKWLTARATSAVPYVLIVAARSSTGRIDPSAVRDGLSGELALAYSATVVPK